MSSFTPGPWVQFVDRGAVYGVAVLPAMREGRIARLERDEDHDAEAVDANARLIAAAPDLYEALKAMLLVEPRDVGHVEVVRAYQRARAALAKVSPQAVSENGNVQGGQ